MLLLRLVRLGLVASASFGLAPLVSTKCGPEPPGGTGGTGGTAPRPKCGNGVVESPFEDCEQGSLSPYLPCSEIPTHDANWTGNVTCGRDCKFDRSRCKRIVCG